MNEPNVDYKALLLQMKLGSFEEQILAKERLERFIETIIRERNMAYEEIRERDLGEIDDDLAGL